MAPQPPVPPQSSLPAAAPPPPGSGPPALVLPLSSPTYSSRHSRSSTSDSIPSPPRRIDRTASLDDLSDDLLSSILVAIAKSATLPPLFRLTEPSLPPVPGPSDLGILGSSSATTGTLDPRPSDQNQRRRQLVPMQVQTLIRLSQVSRRFHSLVHDEFIWLQVYSALNAHRIVSAAPVFSPPSTTIGGPNTLGAARPPLVLSSAPTLASSSAYPAPYVATAHHHDSVQRSPHVTTASLSAPSGRNSVSRGLHLSDFPGSWLALVRDLIRIDKTWRLKQFDVVHLELAPLPAVLAHFSSSDHTVGCRIDDGKLDTAYLSMATDDEPISPPNSARRQYRRGLAVLARHLIRAQPSSSESDDSEGEDEFESFPPTYSRSTYGSTPRSSPIRPTKLRTIHVLDYPSLQVLANHAIFRDPNLRTYPFLPAMQVHYQQHPVVPGASKFYDLTEPNSAGARGGGNALFRLLGLDLPRNRYALCYSARSDTSRCVLAIVDYASDRESAHRAEKHLHSYLGMPFTETFYTLQSGDYMLAYLSPVDPTSTDLFVTIDFLAVDPTQTISSPSPSSSPPNLHLIARHIIPQPADFFYPYPDGRHVPLSKLVIASTNGIFSTWSMPPLHDLTQQMTPLECYSTRSSATAPDKSSLDLDVLYDKPWYRPTILNETQAIRPSPPPAGSSHGSPAKNAPHADAYARREWHQVLVGVRDTSAANTDHLLSPFNRVYELYTLPVPSPPLISRFSSPGSSSTSSLASSTSSGIRTSPASSYLHPPLSATSSPHSSFGSSGSGSGGSSGSLTSNATLTPTNPYTSPTLFTASSTASPPPPPLPRATPLVRTPLFSARIDEPVVWQNMAYHLYLAAHADTWARLVCLDLAAPPRADRPLPMLDLSRPTASRAFTHLHGEHVCTSSAAQGVFACKLARDLWVHGPLGVRVARVVDRAVGVDERARQRDAARQRSGRGLGSPGEESGSSGGTRSLEADTSVDSGGGKVGQEIVGVRRAGMGSGRGRRRVVATSSSEASETEWEEEEDGFGFGDQESHDDEDEDESEESDEMDDDADEGAFVTSIQSLWVGERWDVLAVVCGPALYVLQGDE